MESRWTSPATRCHLPGLVDSSLSLDSSHSMEDPWSNFAFSLGCLFCSFLFDIFLRSSLCNLSILGKHIREGGRRHSGLGNREHHLGRLNWRHCCSPPHQVQVDCQELCKEFLDAVASLALTPLCLSRDKGETDIVHSFLMQDDSLMR